MPEPFKNLFSKALIAEMGEHLAKAWPEFDRKGFTAKAGRNLKSLELKERSNQITAALETFLPDRFEEAAAIMLASLAPDEEEDLDDSAPNPQGISGWGIMPLTQYVGLHGLSHFERSMTLLKEMTKRFTSEFGIRPFLADEPQRTLSVLQIWTVDPDWRVRRLVSEGTRPRLPWAPRIAAFIEDPSPILPLLDALKDDVNENVRRSVANNLNDIAKDHPDRVARIAGQWLKDASKERRNLIHHACRSLVKQGHKATLGALGFGPPRVNLESLEILTPTVRLGEALEFEVRLESTANRRQPLILDYAIHHRKANGVSTPKVFKWKNLGLARQETFAGKRRHAIRRITTRVYYPGAHTLEILVNGVSLGKADFDLVT